MTKNKKLNAYSIARIGLSAAFIAVCSWISFPIGAVPITLQTFAVILVVSLFGTVQGTVAVLIYIFSGAIGLPVFAAFNSGVGYILGPTGGFIIGFIFTAVTEGLITENFKKKIAVPVAMAAGIAVCYIFGTVWFLASFDMAGNPVTLGKALTVCVLPFIIPDAIKTVLASLLSFKLKPLLEKMRRK